VGSLKKGWCVGCNPPSVQCGIRLIGLPALQVALHQRLFALSTCRTAVSPFRIQHSQQLSMLHWHLLDGRFVSAPEPRLSPYALRTLQFYTWGGVSSRLTKSLESHTPTRQPKYNSVTDSNKNFGNLILLHACLWCR